MPFSVFELWQAEGRRERPHQTLQTPKGTRQLRNSPAVPGHFRGNNRLALFTPLANCFFFPLFFFLSYLAAVSDSTSPLSSLPNAFGFSSEIRTELGIFVNCRWGSPARGFRPANVACAQNLVCSPLNCKGIKFSWSCWHRDWEQGEGACRRESGRRGKGKGEEGGKRRREAEEEEREGGGGIGESGRRERERGCNLLPESRTALQIPVLRHAGRMQVRKGTDSAAANPNLGTARCARLSLRPRWRTAAAVSVGGFVTNDLAQSC